MNRNFIFTIILFLMSRSLAFTQSEGNYSFFVAGHTYGSHTGENIGLHPPFLEKLSTDIDSTFFALFLTGDLVNQSTTASWNQVKTELNNMSIPSYYIMGNHDANALGYTAFNEKHGGTFYSFYNHSDLFIILNSTRQERSISSDQVDFLKGVLTSAGTETKRVFIFFHELLWNSDAKYRGMMANSRSRYAQMVNFSNFWSEVFPILAADLKRNYYVIAGDVGGNTDAVSAFYDTRENVTLLASGMGEVSDENYLKVDVSTDTVQFSFIPLNEEITMLPVYYYAVPEKPDTIIGPVEIIPGTQSISYRTGEIFNATSYRWDLPAGISGSSNISSIQLGFGSDYQFDTISVCAVNKGFGESEPFKLSVKAEGYNSFFLNRENSNLKMNVSSKNNEINVHCLSYKRQTIILSVFDLQGKQLYNERILISEGLSTMNFEFSHEQQGIYLVSISDGIMRQTGKISIK